MIQCIILLIYINQLRNIIYKILEIIYQYYLLQIPPLDIIQKFVSEIDYKIDNNNPSSGLFRVKFEDKPAYYNNYDIIPANKKLDS